MISCHGSEQNMRCIGNDIWLKLLHSVIHLKSLHGLHPYTLAVAAFLKVKGKGSPCSITEHKVPELLLVLGSQRAGDVSHKPGSRLPLHSTRPAVTPTTLKRAATNFAAW